MPRKAKAGKIKLKTHKATSKRFRLTGSGKVGAHQRRQEPLAPTHVKAHQGAVD
jgi:ribosomal protein L35